MQLHVALLLGLEWRHAAQWQAIKDRQADQKKLRELVDRDAVPHLGGSVVAGPVSPIASASSPSARPPSVVTASSNPLMRSSSA